MRNLHTKNGPRNVEAPVEQHVSIRLACNWYNRSVRCDGHYAFTHIERACLSTDNFSQLGENNG